MVAINRFADDSTAELETVKRVCESKGVDFALSEVFAKGGEGGTELAEKVVAACEKENSFAPLYPDELSIKEKIGVIAREIYGASGVNYDPAAEKEIARIEALDSSYARLPVCIAKTQYSLSDDQTKLGRPTGFELNVREVKLSAGAGFTVVLTGSIMTMPGLSKEPAAYHIDIDDDGVITGLS